MKRLLFVDDNIVAHDPGDFALPDDLSPGLDEFQQNTPLGLMGYFIRELEREGFDVCPAAGIGEALDYLVEHEPWFDVIIIDIMMPYQNTGKYNEENTAGGLRTGFVLAEDIHNEHPETPIWILSQIAPSKGTMVNKATVDDLLSRGVVAQVVFKMDCDPADFAKEVRQSLEAG